VKDIASPGSNNVSPLNIGGEKTKGSGLIVAATFVIPATIVVGLMFLLIRFQGGLEAAVADLARLLPVGYAFAAGMVASVNPCGALMLPTYILYQLGAGEAGSSAARRALRGLLIAVAVTAGFIVIFAAAGSIITVGGRWLITAFPYAGLLIGAVMIALGLWLLVTHRTLGILAASRVAVNPKQNLGNAFLFGIAYAVGSLSCTLPIFLVVVGSALASEGLLFSFGQFIGYALGMGAVIVAVTIGTALFQQAVAKWLRRLTPYVHRLSAMFLIGAGAYLIYYWVFQAGLAL
jgi:cytochrome c-type biogenesis protein